MKIAIIGGTGAFGRGMALRWGLRHRVVIGSRDAVRAQDVAAECQDTLGPRAQDAGISGLSNREAAEQAQVAVFSVKHDNLEAMMDACGPALAGKVIISPVAPLVKKEIFQGASMDQGSAAGYLQAGLPDSKVVAALHTIPAHRMRKWNQAIKGDVPVCGDNPEAKKLVMDLIREIKDLRPLDSGPLRAAELIEPIVPLLLNLKIFGGLKSTSVQFV